MLGTPRRARLIGALVIAAAALGALSACSSNAAKAPETVYSVWVSGGSDIASVQYRLVDADGTAHTYTAKPGRDTWSQSADAGTAAVVKVRPAGNGVAHCVISRPGSHTIPEQKTGMPGGALTCRATLQG
jgi:hypothetical protein